MVRKDLEIIETRFNARRKPGVLKKTLEKKGKTFLFRQTSYMTTIIHNNIDYSFPNRNEEGFAINQLWVFRSVKMDARKFLQVHPDWEAPKKLPTNVTNYDYDDSYGELEGTDIDSAYWVMAYRLGMISDNTFKRAGGDEYKRVRLAALAVLGRNTAYQNFEKGKLDKTKPVIIEPEHPKMKDMYRSIRYKCYEMMNDMAALLGNEFEAYRTDCIYYRGTKENRKIVHNYLRKLGFNFKQLVFEDKKKKKA